MAEKPPFDPAQPFDVAASSPSVNAADKPPFNPNQPFDTATSGSSAATPDAPMPGPIDASIQGFRHGLGDISQSAEVVSGQNPSARPAEESPAAQSFELRDLYEPSRGLSKVGYQLGASSPALGGGIAGGLMGSLVGPTGTLLGGAAGSAMGAAFQTIGPVFASELKRTPRDPDGAWARALEHATVSGLFSGASWAAFPLKAFQGPLKNLAFQAFGVQPSLNMAEQGVKNVIDQKPVTEGMGEAYKQGAVMTAVPAVGHLALKGRYGEPQVTDTEPTPQDIVASVAQKRATANQLLTQSAQPGLSPQAINKLQNRASDMNEIANFEEDRHKAQQRIPFKLQMADQLEQGAQNPALNPIQQRNLIDQAKGLRDTAREDGFVANLPPPLSKPEGGIRGRLKEWYLNNIDPSMRSEAALKADAVIAKFKAQRAQLEDAITNRGEKTYAYKWMKVDPADQNHFLYSVETGTPLRADVLARHPWMDQAKTDYRSQLDLSYRLEAQMGSRSAYLENYFPHIWKDVEQARQVFQPDNMIRSMGPTWFQKARTYDLIELGQQNGLELRHNNIQDIVNSRLMSGADMINKMEMLHDLQRNGVAVPTERAPPQVINPKLIDSPHPWQEVTAPSGERWMIAPDAQDLWKNGVEAKGLWSNEGAVGDAFRGWMKLKNLWVPIKLGLSLFHPVHVAHIDAVNHMNRALNETFRSGQQSIGNRVTALPKAIGQIARDFANLPEELLHAVSGNFFRRWQPPSLQHPGARMREAWLTPAENRTAAQNADVKLMTEAGISAQLSEQMRTRGMRDFMQAINDRRILPATMNGARVGMGKLSHWIFEEWIPNLKMAALKQEAGALFQRRPDLISDPTNRQVALRALGKQIDNRFGEMFYGSLFWNRTLKDASIGSFLSLGWNLGFAREFGGGAFEPIVRKMIDAPNPTRKLVRDTTTKTANMFLYSMTAFAINGMMNKAFTGDNPDGLDYIFPRIGGLNPDGSPRRITNAFYTREVPMAMKNIEEQQSVVGGLTQMLYHKMLFSPFVEMGQNKDYFGNQIFDENAPFYQKARQFMTHLGADQLNPMSVAGAKRALQLSGKPFTTADVLKQLSDRDVVMPLLGFGPAPGYASKSPLENRIQYLFRRYVAPEAKSFETGAHSLEKSEARTAYMGAIQRGDDAAKLAAARKLASLGVATKEINKLQPGGSIQYMFQRLPGLDQKALLKTMSKEEFKVYYPKTQKKMRGDPEVVALARKYYAP